MTPQEQTSSMTDLFFSRIYGDEDTAFHRDRWTALLREHEKRVGSVETRLFSVPGRSELAGNHTDHNRGLVLATALQLDTIAAVTPTDDEFAEVLSSGYPPVRVNLNSLAKDPAEKGRSDALVRGIAAGFADRKGRYGGFRASTTSRVPGGSGLSSSAALEVLVGCIFNALYNGNRFGAADIAVMGREAENHYFGKPCGLMDQLACAHGGVILIDFNDSASPKVETVDASCLGEDYSLAILDTGGHHADLTPDYAMIPQEMRAVAEALGGRDLRETSEDGLMRILPEVRRELGDRAVLRALHFYGENRRVKAMGEALKKGNVEAYLDGVRSSGDSSYRFLQNVFSSRRPEGQGISLALALTERFLGGSGACRVHGGGFAGGIQVYLPRGRLDEYRAFMAPVFGGDAVTALSIRKEPAGELLPP